MEYAKDEIFEIRYNSKLDKLQLGKGKKRKILNAMKRHKLITTVMISFVIFASVNIAMICSFINILQNL